MRTWTIYFGVMLMFFLLTASPYVSAQMFVKNTANNELMRVTQEGRLGLGTTAPKAQASIIGCFPKTDDVGDWKGESTFFPYRLGLHVRTELPPSPNGGKIDVQTQDAIRGTTLIPGGSDSYWHFYTGVRGMAVDEDQNYILAQGCMGFNILSPNEGRLLYGVSGVIPQVNLVHSLANRFVAVEAEVIGNESNYPNVYGLYVLGGKSYFSHAVGIGTTHPRTGYWIDVNGAAYCDGMNWVNGSSRELKKRHPTAGGGCSREHAEGIRTRCL